MATNKLGNSHRHSDAQPTRDNRDNQTEQQPKQGGSTADAAVRARQRRTDVEIRREKRWERWRARETTIVRRASEQQPGPQQDARDHRGEVR